MLNFKPRLTKPARANSRRLATRPKESPTASESNKNRVQLRTRVALLSERNRERTTFPPVTLCKQHSRILFDFVDLIFKPQSRFTFNMMTFILISIPVRCWRRVGSSRMAMIVSIDWTESNRLRSEDNTQCSHEETKAFQYLKRQGI